MDAKGGQGKGCKEYGQSVAKGAKGANNGGGIGAKYVKCAIDGGGVM